MLQRLQLATFLATGFSFGIVPLFFLLFFPWLVVAGQRHSIVYGLHGHTEPGSASEMFVVGKYQLLEPKRPRRWGPKGHHLRVGLGGYLTRGLWGSGYHPKGPVGPARCCPGTLSWPRRQEWVALFFSMHPNFDCCCCCCFVTDRVFLSWVFFFFLLTRLVYVCVFGFVDVSKVCSSQSFSLLCVFQLFIQLFKN